MIYEWLEKVVQETYMNVWQEGTHKYKIKPDDFRQIAENILDNEHFWGNLDFLILEELQKYEIN